MRNKYTDKQIEVLRKYYPLGDWDSILPFFPNTPKINIRATARGYYWQKVQHAYSIIS